jgi:uncharacterized protein (TIGR02145 family)
MKTNSRFLLLAISIAFTISCTSFNGGNLEAASSYVDMRDGKVYRTAVIGEQTWMAENLDYAVDGSECYDNDPANCAKYGRLYDWETAKTACPSGWHLPANEEWKELIDFAGGEKVAGKRLKANSTDDYGFSALPGGEKSEDFSRHIGGFGIWWSTSKYSNSSYYRFGMKSSSDAVFGFAFTDLIKKKYFYSVRCVKDLATGEKQ